jgi:hypothetical protein
MDAAKESIERLFNEPFEPAWMKRQREAEQEDWARWKKVLKEKADLQWKLEAEKSHQRIMKNCRGVWRIA